MEDSNCTHSILEAEISCSYDPPTNIVYVPRDLLPMAELSSDSYSDMDLSELSWKPISVLESPPSSPIPVIAEVQHYLPPDTPAVVCAQAPMPPALSAGHLYASIASYPCDPWSGMPMDQWQRQPLAPWPDHSYPYWAGNPFVFNHVPMPAINQVPMPLLNQVPMPLFNQVHTPAFNQVPTPAFMPNQVPMPAFMPNQVPMPAFMSSINQVSLPGFNQGPDNDFNQGPVHDVEHDFLQEPAEPVIEQEPVFSPQEPVVLHDPAEPVMEQGPDPARNIAQGRFPPCHSFNGYHAKNMLAVGDHLYKLERVFKGTTYYRCDEHCGTIKCNVRVRTKHGVISHMNKREHKHPSVPGKAHVEEVFGDAMERAATHEEAINDILQASLARIKDEHRHHMPQIPSIVRNLQRSRFRANFTTLDKYMMTINGDEEFIRYNQDGMVICAADKDIRFLAQCNEWHCDGTFKITPDGYYQQYTIHGYYDGVTYPCVYALLPGKSREIYENMLDEIINLFPQIPDPDSIMVDYEQSAILAFTEKFPMSEIAGCYFHLGQSFWRKIQDLKLDKKYKDEPEFATRVRKFLALAFVPIDQVHEYLLLLIDDEVERGDGFLTEFYLYVQKWYVGQMLNGREISQGRFPKEMWNMYQRVKDGLPRTNNSLEGWHNAFARNMNHPALHLLVAKYRREQHTKGAIRFQHQHGILTPRQRSKYQKVTKRIQYLIRKFDTRVVTGLEYLEKLASKMTIPM